jgi:hypothetical protein
MSLLEFFFLVQNTTINMQEDYNLEWLRRPMVIQKRDLQTCAEELDGSDEDDCKDENLAKISTYAQLSFLDSDHWTTLHTLEFDMTNFLPPPQSFQSFLPFAWPQMPQMKNAKFDCVLDFSRVTRWTPQNSKHAGAFLSLVAGFLNATMDLETISIAWSFGDFDDSDDSDDFDNDSCEGLLIQAINERHHAALESLEVPIILLKSREAKPTLNVTCRRLTLGCHCQDMDEHIAFGGKYELSRASVPEMVIQGKSLISKPRFSLPPGLEGLIMERTSVFTDLTMAGTRFSDILFSECKSSLRSLTLDIYRTMKADLLQISQLDLEEIRVHDWPIEDLMSLIAVCKPGSMVYFEGTPLDMAAAGADSLADLALSLVLSNVKILSCGFKVTGNPSADEIQTMLTRVSDSLTSTFHVASVFFQGNGYTSAHLTCHRRI